MNLEPQKSYQRARLIALVRSAFAAVLLSYLVFGCASTRGVNLTVTSEPPGGYVLLQVLVPERGKSDWIYVGSTPLVVVREIDLQQTQRAELVTLKVMKEGYFDGTKVWQGERFVNECKKQGGIFWNPHLVPSRR